MKFKFQHVEQPAIDDNFTPALSILFGETEVPDYNFHLPEDADLSEYDKYMYELMEGIFGACEGVTEDQIREFLISKGYEEVK